MRALLVTATLAVAATAGPSAAAAGRICEQSESIVTGSPNARWAASVQHQVCETAAGGVSAAVTVFVGEAAAPLQGARVVAIAVPRTRDEWPIARWRDAHALEVWVPNLANVLEAQDSWGEVKVTLKYCGDDPAARQRVAEHETDLAQWREAVTRWADKRRSDPAAAGERPARPEEPRTVVRACTDADLAG